MDEMDPILDLLNQRPRVDWEWKFSPDAGGSAENVVALCNAALLAYSPGEDVRKYLANWGFTDTRNLRGFSSQGFVAKQGKTVLVSFRGTEPTKADDWLSDVNYHHQIVEGIPGPVHGGFSKALLETQHQMLDAIGDLAGEEGTRIYFTGHSLGGSLAVLAAALLHFRYRREVAGVVTYGQPRIGSPEFCQAYNAALGQHTFRYVNDLDIVPHLPPTRLPARMVPQSPAPPWNYLQKLKEWPATLIGTFKTLSEGQRFSHVGELRLILPDGKITSDELEWQRREVLYSGTTFDLFNHLPYFLHANLRKMLQPGNRISDHDPLHGYLPKLEAHLS